MTTREASAAAARDILMSALFDLRTTIEGRYGMTPVAWRIAENAALAKVFAAVGELESLATMTDDEFEVDRVDPTPDEQWQVTTPAEVWS